MYVSLLLSIYHFIVAHLKYRVTFGGDFRFILRDFNPPYKWLKFSR